MPGRLVALSYLFDLHFNSISLGYVLLGHEVVHMVYIYIWVLSVMGTSCLKQTSHFKDSRVEWSILFVDASTDYRYWNDCAYFLYLESLERTIQEENPRALTVFFGEKWWCRPGVGWLVGKFCWGVVLDVRLSNFSLSFSWSMGGGTVISSGKASWEYVMMILPGLCVGARTFYDIIHCQRNIVTFHPQWV